MISLIQCDPEVPAGTITEWLRSNNTPFRILRAFSEEPLPAPDASGAAIVLGGSMGFNDVGRHPFLSTIKSFIREAADLYVPFLGICLGGQLLADALGAHVHSGRHGEKGVHSVKLVEAAAVDPLFSGIPAVFSTFQWHDDSFELPRGAVLLASSDTCAHQAFRYGASMYGLQFHPEVTRKIVAAWTRNSDDEVSPVRFMDEYIRKEGSYLTVSRNLLENFLRISRLIA